MKNNANLCGLIGIATKAGKIVCGTDACLEQIHKGNVNLILIAQDCSDRTKTKFNQVAKDFNVPIYTVLSIEEMSKAMGKQNKAVVGIKDVGFSNKIINMINGGEYIG